LGQATLKVSWLHTPLRNKAGLQGNCSGIPVI
jgi:hypothetical protein